MRVQILLVRFEVLGPHIFLVFEMWCHRMRLEERVLAVRCGACTCINQALDRWWCWNDILLPRELTSALFGLGGCQRPDQLLLKFQHRYWLGHLTSTSTSSVVAAEETGFPKWAVMSHNLTPSTSHPKTKQDTTVCRNCSSGNKYYMISPR